jgi:release factor glutamine methyltransferase
MTIAEAIALAQERLEAAGVESPLEDGVSLLEHLLGLPRAQVMLERQRKLEPAEWERYLTYLGRRARREPLQHILGVACFYGLTLEVSAAALVPRPETERLVELALQALEALESPKVVDVGTGGGAIALAVKAERRDAVVTASELSKEALDLAERNARRLGLEVRFIQSDLLQDPELQEALREADLLLGNLPYLPEGDKRWISPEVEADPEGALFSGADGLDHFRRLAPQAHALLGPGAMVMLELDPRNSTRALELSTGWSEARLAEDLLGRPRFLLLRK